MMKMLSKHAISKKPSGIKHVTVRPHPPANAPRFIGIPAISSGTYQLPPRPPVPPPVVKPPASSVTGLLIPRVLHAIWVGPHHLSERYHHFLKLRQQVMPHWTMKLWTNKEAEEMHMINRAQYDAAMQPAQKADILRLEIIHQHGGIYADIDFEFIRPFDHLLPDVSFICSKQTNGRIMPICNGFFGAVKDHPITAHLIQVLPRTFMSSKKILNQTGPGLFSDVIEQHSEATVMDRNLLFPPEWRHLRRRKDVNLVKELPNAIAVHHGDHNWT